MLYLKWENLGLMPTNTGYLAMLWTLILKFILRRLWGKYSFTYILYVKISRLQGIKQFTVNQTLVPDRVLHTAFGKQRWEEQESQASPTCITRPCLLRFKKQNKTGMGMIKLGQGPRDVRCCLTTHFYCIKVLLEADSKRTVPSSKVNPNRRRSLPQDPSPSPIITPLPRHPHILTTPSQAHTLTCRDMRPWTHRPSLGAQAGNRLYNPVTTLLYLAEVAVAKICPAQFFFQFQRWKISQAPNKHIGLDSLRAEGSFPHCTGASPESRAPKCRVDHLRRC